MFSQWNQYVKDPSVVRRLAFAANFYPRSMPFYWERCLSFGVKENEPRCTLSLESARTLIQNTEAMDREMFVCDDDLVREISKCSDEESRGVVLVSPRYTCLECGSKLHIRPERFSSVILYDDRYGTMTATHYVKYCRKRNCSLQQYYGFYTKGCIGKVHYNEDWHTLPYFLSSRETAISMDLLKRLDIEILIGQISYKQRADIYNEVHGCTNGEDARSGCIYM